MQRETAMAPRLWRADFLEGATIGARDGDIGRVVESYFDDQSWTVRYLVVDIGTWLPGRQVLISPCSITDVEVTNQRLVADLSREQVKHSPGIDTARPVSRQHEAVLLQYYGLPFYWMGPYRWGPSTVPAAPAGSAAVREASNAEMHLRSTPAVRGFGIHATDGDLGHVVDFLIDEDAWAIRYLIVDPRSWWPGPHVLLATDWVTEVGWRDGRVHVSVSREAVRNAPTYDTRSAIERDYETRLHEHYGRRGYWVL
jgi:hypothetical protein